jgi:hypothetical protein
MKSNRGAPSRRNRGPIASPASAECRDGNIIDPSHCLAEGADAAPELTSGPFPVEAYTGEDRAEDPAPPEADDRPLKADPAKAYRRHIKNAVATLEALEGREHEAQGMAPDSALEIVTLERVQARNSKLLRRMRAQRRDFAMALRELKAMLDRRDDFVSTWMEKPRRPHGRAMEIGPRDEGSST